MPSITKITINLKPLEKLQKELKKPLVTKVGIMGSKANRGGATSNVMIGAVHEFGSFIKGIPMRSWLKMPLLEKRDRLLKRLALFMKILLPKGQIKRIYTLLGITAEAIIRESFVTRGFGKWKDITQKTKDRKGSNQILIDSAQLSKAVISKVGVQK